MVMYCVLMHKKINTIIDGSFIVPSIKTGDMSVAATSEAIAITEDLDPCAWIVKSQEQMKT